MKNDHACQTNVSQLYVISHLLDNRDQILAKISKFDQKKKTNMILYIVIQRRTYEFDGSTRLDQGRVFVIKN